MKRICPKRIQRRYSALACTIDASHHFNPKESRARAEGSSGRCGRQRRGYATLQLHRGYSRTAYVSNRPVREPPIDDREFA
jgi:hypothetical protein